MNLDSYRKKHDLSQEQLADKLKCSPAFVSQLLNNKRGISVPNARLYSERLDGEVTVNDFLGLFDPPAKLKKHTPFFQKIKNLLHRRPHA